MLGSESLKFWANAITARAQRSSLRSKWKNQLVRIKKGALLTREELEDAGLSLAVVFGKNGGARPVARGEIFKVFLTPDRRSAEFQCFDGFGLRISLRRLTDSLG